MRSDVRDPAQKMQGFQLRLSGCACDFECSQAGQTAIRRASPGINGLSGPPTLVFRIMADLSVQGVRF